MTQERKTASMLQRIPVILAVTAASYGLQVPQQATRWSPHPVAQRTQAPSAQPLPSLPRPPLRA